MTCTLLASWFDPAVLMVRFNCCCRYLVLFLKFIASVVPTIQYDYTMSVGGQ